MRGTPTSSIRQVERLSPRAVRLLRTSSLTLIGRARRGTPSQLRAHAERLRLVQDELRFSMPALATWLGDLAAGADAAALKIVSARAVRRFDHGCRLTWPTHGLAKFSRRFT